MYQDNANRHKDCSNAPGERTGDGTKGLGWVGPDSGGSWEGTGGRGGRKAPWLPPVLPEGLGRVGAQ